MTGSNMKKRCLACENHFVSVSSFLTQSNDKIGLKGFYFSISQTTFFTRPFYTFFSFEDVSQPFSGSDQYIHTFLQASLDRKHFQRLEKLLNHDHHRSVKQVMFSYCLFEYFLSTHFFHCRKSLLQEASLGNSNYTCELCSICRRHVDLLPLLPAFWYSLCNFWIEFQYQGIFHFQ